MFILGYYFKAPVSKTNISALLQRYTLID